MTIARALLVVFAALALGAPRAEAQAHANAPKEPAPTAPPASAPSHGIIRKGQPRPAQAATVAPVAAAIAAAVKSVEETKKPAAPRPAPAVRPRPAPRRYVLRWPDRRVEVKWAVPEDRVTLAWTDLP
jgi:hypothetical protein